MLIVLSFMLEKKVFGKGSDVSWCLFEEDGCGDKRERGKVTVAEVPLVSDGGCWPWRWD